MDPMVTPGTEAKTTELHDLTTAQPEFPFVLSMCFARDSHCRGKYL